MATTTQHINARNDPDLLDRFIAAAEQAGVEDASRIVQANMGKLVTQPVGDAQVIADVHAFAATARDEYLAATPDRPGADLARVTDAQLASAIRAVFAPTTEEAPA